MPYATLKIMPTLEDLESFQYSNDLQEALEWLREHFNTPLVECDLFLLAKPFCGSRLGISVDGICIPKHWVKLESVHGADKTIYYEALLLDNTLIENGDLTSTTKGQ